MATEERARQEGRESGQQQKQVQSRCSTPSSSSSAQPVAVEAIADHVSCGLCGGPVASSLLLSCSHLFCGSCLFTKLQQRASCPTCNMDLRAIPVRCLAMDKVAAVVVPSLTTQEQQQYSKRKQDGQCVADQVNKLFHHLGPAPSFNSSIGASRPGVVAPTCLPAAGHVDFTSSTAVNPVHRRTYPGAAIIHPSLQQQKQYPNLIGASFGSFPAAAAGSAAPNLMHIAAAQHLQLMQQQLTALNLNPAAAAASAGAQFPCRQTVGDKLALQQSLFVRNSNLNGSVLGPNPPAAALPAAMAGHGLQLNTVLGNMCHV
eukprot:GHUV01010782.1.p1 GENE.GHUV01010782.1~~GHUV01010782.1.p1  ORF type:complete len:359 (+),score=86.57 GHUV01010782.1:130-1077(+)